MNEVLELPFDQYQRYRLVSDLIGRLPKGEALRVLDVGGRTGILRSFLPLDRVELVDLEPSDVPGLVLGTGSQLPFREGAFDVVAAFDTLEHVPPAGRTAFLDECARVAKGWVFIAGPYRTPEVDEAEELLQSFLHSKLQLRHRYLEEHRTHGLPVRAHVEARFRELGGAVESFGHGNLDRWVALMCMEMYMDADPGLRPIAARFFRFYNERLYASDHALPVYRHVVVAAYGGRELPETEGLLDTPVAPREALPPIQRLSEELLAFDREKDVWKPEFARLESELAALELDLAGHRERLTEREADLGEHRASLAELQGIHDKALAEHGDEKRALESDLEEHRGSLKETQQILEDERREQGDIRRALEADLAEHARALEAAKTEGESAAEQARELEGTLRAEVAGLQAGLAELREHLVKAEQGAQSIQGELVRARSDIEGLQRELAERDGRIAQMHAALRDRLGNLKRAFARRKWGE